MPKKLTARSARQEFDKFHYYTNSVQSAEHDAELLWTILRKTWTGTPLSRPVLQEDFCGTGCLCFEWAKLGSTHQAVGIDLDPEALAWGNSRHRARIKESQSKRVRLINGNVLHDHGVKPHMICALNFSYFFIKDRALLRKYFAACKKSLIKGGVLALDVFGGPDYLMPHMDRRRNDEHKFDYWWEIKKFDALSNDIDAAIHFKPDGQPPRKNVFQYHWRLWSIPEITDVLKESGFSQVEYWSEGLDDKGYGNGKFRRIKSETECETWVAYIIAK